MGFVVVEPLFNSSSCMHASLHHPVIVITLFYYFSVLAAAMKAFPVFRFNHQARVMVPTAEAKQKENTGSGRAQTEELVLAEATESVRARGGDPSNRMLLLANCKLQFGKYQGQTFIWLLENALGYATYLASSIDKAMEERQKNNNLSANKLLFLEYVENIPDMQEEIARFCRTKDAQAEASRTGDDGLELLGFGRLRDSTRKEVYESTDPDARAFVSGILARKDVRPNTLMHKFRSYISKRRQQEQQEQKQQQQQPPHSASGASVRPRVHSFLERTQHLPPEQFSRKLAAMTKTTGTHKYYIKHNQINVSFLSPHIPD